jgi:hypothetical protein
VNWSFPGLFIHNLFEFKIWMLLARPRLGEATMDRFFDEVFALDGSNDVWKHVSYGKKREAEHEPLRMRVLSFILQTLSKLRQFCPNSRTTRRSLLVRT